MQLNRRYVYMEQAGGDAAGGAGGDAAAAGGDKGGQSALAAAAAADATARAAAAAAGADPNAWLPEKFRVFDGEGEAKKLNLEASAKKLAADGYTPLEKRLGGVGAPPEKPEGYKTDGSIATLKAAAGGKDVVLPEAFVKDFSAWAHGAGLSQAQFDKALPAMMGAIPGLIEEHHAGQMKAAQAHLVKVWGADGMKPDSPQMQDAYKAFMQFAPAQFRTAEGMDRIGNDPLVLQVLAAIGQEMREDKRPGGEGAGGEDVQALMNSQPYWDKKHADHLSTVRKVNDFFAKGGKVKR